MKQIRYWEYENQSRQHIDCPNILYFCDREAERERHKAADRNEIRQHWFADKRHDEPAARIKNCGITMMSMAAPSTAAKISEAKISIDAFDSKTVKSPVIPSLNAPKILVPLAQNTAATVT